MFFSLAFSPNSRGEISRRTASGEVARLCERTERASVVRRAISMTMPRKKLPKQRQKSRLLRILISPTEFKAWAAESKAKHDGVLSAFVRERVNASLDAHEHPTLVVSGDLAERIVKSGRTADALVCDALDRAESIAAMTPATPKPNDAKANRA